MEMVLSAPLLALEKALDKSALLHIHTWVVAVSGGVDSLSLAHGLSQLLKNRQSHPRDHQAWCDFRVIWLHIHHGLHPQADDWAAEVARQGEALGVEVRVHHVSLPQQNRRGLEDLARQARWQVFNTYLQPHTALVLAHHANDQAETLLLRLFRGAGVQGLAAMQAWQQRQAAWVVRPWLGMSRSQIHALALDLDLRWVEDPSNSDIRLKRNWLRHQLIPLLETTYPQVVNTLVQTAHRMEQAQAVLLEVAQMDYAQADACAESMAVAPLQALSEARQINLLRYWLSQTLVLLPDQQRLQRIQQQMLWDPRHASGKIQLNAQWYVRKQNHRLFLKPQTDAHSR